MKTDSLPPREASPREDTADGPFPYRTDISAEMRTGQTSVGVVLTLAELLERPPEAMPSPQSVVDCDALDKLFHFQHTDNSPTDTAVTISYAGYSVTIRGDGCFRIRDKR